MAFVGENVDVLQNRVRNCASFLNAYRWLTDSFILDFFTEDHWNKLPRSWADAIESLTPQEIGEWVSGHGCRSRTVFPLSLLAFKVFVKGLALDRTALATPGQVIGYLRTHHFCFHPSAVNTEEWDGQDSALGGLPRDLKNVFRKHVKPKKQHELYRLSQACALISEATGCKHVVDVGAGVGHLSRFLSYGYGLNLLCVESQRTLATSASKLDGELESACSKLGISRESQKPKHVNLTLHPDTGNLIQVIEPHSDQKPPSYGLIGLHTCGDLGPTLIRNFAQVPEVKFILVVGCCYMKMDLDRPVASRGFPMSAFVRNSDTAFASYEAFEMACHALESYCDRLKQSEVDKLKVHCYRATLETLLVLLDPPVKRAGLRSVKNAHLMPFEQYALKALDKLDVQLDLTKVQSPYSAAIQSCLDQWKRVVAFYSLRLLIAPVIETVIQLDRLIFLAEQGWNGCLLPLFDCRLSPRNFALLCVKPALERTARS